MSIEADPALIRFINMGSILMTRDVVMYIPTDNISYAEFTRYFQETILPQYPNAILSPAERPRTMEDAERDMRFGPSMGRIIMMDGSEYIL